MISESFVSVVIIQDEDGPSLASRLAEIHGILDSLYTDFEILIVRQGPLPFGQKRFDSVLDSLSCIRILQLASRVRSDIAWAAGLENAIGDFVVLFDPANDPTAILPNIVETCRNGADVVVGTAEPDRSLPYVLFRGLAGWILKAIEYELPKNATSLRCLSRRAVNAVTRTGQFHRQLQSRIQRSGYCPKEFSYVRIGRARQRGLIAGVREVLQLAVFNSARPLRWMSGFGILGSAISVLAGLYSVAIHLINRNVVEGWTTTIVLIASLFFVQFVMLAFFGEYLGRLLEEKGESAGYSVAFEDHSCVMVNSDRVNVHSGSTTRESNLVQTGRNR